MNFLAITLVFSTFSGCAQESWVAKTSLPKILVMPIAPTTNAQAFERSEYSRDFRYKSGPTTPSEPFESDAKAISAAVEFLTTHFGTSPLELITESILHSSSGYESPRNNADRGHTITFRAHWHGIKINECFAIVYINGKTIAGATIQLGQPTVLSNSIKQIISKERAVQNWRKQVVKHFGAPKDITPKIVDLVYVWSTDDNDERDEQRQGSVLSPNWAIRISKGGEELLVDAYSGRVWRND